MNELPGLIKTYLSISTQKHVLWTIVGPDSSSSPFEMLICLNALPHRLLTQVMLIFVSKLMQGLFDLAIIFDHVLVHRRGAMALLLLQAILDN